MSKMDKVAALAADLPELNKLQDVTKEFNSLHHFLDYVSEQEIGLARFNTHIAQYQALVQYEIEKLVYDFFDLDPKKIEAERAQLLKSLRDSYDEQEG